jgi:hypothetical protein
MAYRSFSFDLPTSKVSAKLVFFRMRRYFQTPRLLPVFPHFRPPSRSSAVGIDGEASHLFGSVDEATTSSILGRLVSRLNRAATCRRCMRCSCFVYRHYKKHSQLAFRLVAPCRLQPLYFRGRLFSPGRSGPFFRRLLIFPA